ncbi:MAG: UbiD family decarboxylase [Actinomycetota bacterium]|nr:UbiD family decarboxylase [Actinomycetota bacterium]
MSAGLDGGGQDLQSFIGFLEKHHPDEVLHVTKEVDPIFEATALLWSLENQRRYPVVVFDNIKGSSMPCVTNVHASFPRLAMAIGLPKDASVRDFIFEYMKREGQPIPPKLIDTGPVKDVVLTGDDVDVTKLPSLKYHDLDSGQMDPGYEHMQGRYLTLAYDVMKDPDSGVPNVGIYRLQVKGRNKFGIQISETAHGHYIMQKNLKRGRPTPMAAVVGLHPAVELGCLSFTSFDVDEWTIAGAMLGEPLQMVKCETIDVEVPAFAEIVLECEIHPDEREPEAPFGEYPGTYGPERINPVVYVKAITMRKKAHYQSSFVGHADNLLLSGVTRNSSIYNTCRIASGAVKSVYVPLSGRCRYICYVQMEKLIEGDPKNAAMAAFTADPFLKYVVVVDDDVDIMDDTQVLHAIATRVRWDHDAFVVTHSRGSPLDPASYDPAGGSHLVTKVGIDATRKANYPKEISTPGVGEIDLSDYFGDAWERVRRD